MPRSWNASDGRLWAAEFADGTELHRCMTGSWLLAQPGIDRIVARPAAAAIEGYRPRFVGGDLRHGPQTVVLRAKAARADALNFSADLGVFDGTIAEVLAEHHPRYAGQPSSTAPLGGAKHGRPDEWDVHSHERLGIAGVIALMALVALVAVVVAALWGEQIVAAANLLMRLVLVGGLVWLVVHFRRWLRG